MYFSILRFIEENDMKLGFNRVSQLLLLEYYQTVQGIFKDF